MDIYTLIKQRRSVRAYQDRPVPEEVLERLLEAARWAPSARNLQRYKLVVVRNEQRRQALAQAACEQSFIAQAPVVLAAVTLEPERIMTCAVPAGPMNVSIAMDHLMLAATAEGLGTCWIGAFEQDPVKAILGVPESYRVEVLMPVGYPADQPGEKTRKKLDELVCEEQFE